MIGVGLTNILATIQSGVTAINNLSQVLTQATARSSSLIVSGVSTTVGTVTTVNTSIGLTGGPITTSGTIAVSLPFFATTLSSNVALNNTASFFNGPTVTQGTSGVWFACGTIIVEDPSLAVFVVRVSDGTNTAGTTEISVSAGFAGSVSVSGFFTNPSSNIRIQAQDATTTSGVIVGGSSQSFLNVVRIG